MLEIASEGAKIAGVALIGLMQALYTIYLLVVASSPVMKNKHNYNHVSCSPTSVAIIVPLFHESIKSVRATLDSIKKQDYPNEKMRVILVVENDDGQTKKALEELYKEGKLDSLTINIIEANCRENGKGKSCALNTALNHVIEEVFIVFDADDDIPPDYVRKAVCMLKDGHTVVTTKVYREGNNLTSRFLTLDTLLWYDLIIYTPYMLGGYIPLSGEGLAVRTNYLRKIGGFPDRLTEDACLSIHLARDHQRIGYLNSAYIIERAPRSWKSYARQRLRWMQGFMECFKDLIKNALRGKVGWKSAPLALLFFSPVITAATMISYLMLIIYWIGYLASSEPIISLYSILFPAPIFYWSLANLVIGNLFLLYIILYLIGDTRYSNLAPYTLLLPLYWFMLGIIATASFFARKEWRKTER